MDNRWLIGIGVASTAVVLIAVAIYLLTSLPAPLAAVKSFYAAVERNDYKSAYALFHPDLRQSQSFAEFENSTKVHPSFFDLTYRLWSTEATDSTATVEGQLTTRGGGEVSATFRLVKQSGEWQIIAYRMQGESGAVDVGAPP